MAEEADVTLLQPTAAGVRDDKQRSPGGLPPSGRPESLGWSGGGASRPKYLSLKYKLHTGYMKS